MAAIYVYECRDHGRFEVPMRFGGDVPTAWKCPSCRLRGKRVILPPAAVLIEGGTGARRSG